MDLALARHLDFLSEAGPLPPDLAVAVAKAVTGFMSATQWLGPPLVTYACPASTPAHSMHAASTPVITPAGLTRIASLVSDLDPQGQSFSAEWEGAEYDEGYDGSQEGASESGQQRVGRTDAAERWAAWSRACSDAEREAAAAEEDAAEEEWF